MAIRIFQRLEYALDKYGLYGSTEDIQQFDERALNVIAQSPGLRTVTDPAQNVAGVLVVDDPVDIQYSPLSSDFAYANMSPTTILPSLEYFANICSEMP